MENGGNPGTRTKRVTKLDLFQRLSTCSHNRVKWELETDEVTVARLIEGVVRNDLAVVMELLRVKPELAGFDLSAGDERRALHFAVVGRSPEMVRVLVEHGADPNQGVYPYRRLTTPLAIALDRGYHEIVEILQSPARPSACAEPDPECTIGALSQAVSTGNIGVVRELLDRGLDPDERQRVGGLEEEIHSFGRPLQIAAAGGMHAIAELLLERGADPNGHVYAAGTPVHTAVGRGDRRMVELLVRHGGVVLAESTGYFRAPDLAREVVALERSGRLAEASLNPGSTLGADFIEGGASGGCPEVLRMGLDRVDWQPGDPRWHKALHSSMAFWNHIPWLEDAHPEFDRGTYIECFQMILARSGGRTVGALGRTVLHDVAAMRSWVTDGEVESFARAALAAGASLDGRDELLQGTPLAWACQWGRSGLVKLLLRYGADPVDDGAESWATPLARARKSGNEAVLSALLSGLHPPGEPNAAPSA